MYQSYEKSYETENKIYSNCKYESVNISRIIQEKKQSATKHKKNTNTKKITYINKEKSNNKNSYLEISNNRLVESARPSIKQEQNIIKATKSKISKNTEEITKKEVMLPKDKNNNQNFQKKSKQNEEYIQAEPILKQINQPTKVKFDPFKDAHDLLNDLNEFF